MGYYNLSKVFVITQPAALELDSVTQVNLSCNGASDGTATVHVEGGSNADKPYQYKLDDGSYGPYTSTTDSVFTGLAAGTHTIYVKDNCTGSGHELSKVFVITQPAALELDSVTQVNLSCNGASDGTATVHVEGGSSFKRLT